MNQLGATTPLHPTASHSDPQAGVAIVVSAVSLTPEQEIAQLRARVLELQSANLEKDRTIAQQNEEMAAQTQVIRKGEIAQMRLSKEIQITQRVSENLERILSDLNDIQVNDPISFFDYLMNQMPAELDCQVRYYIPHSTLDPEVRVEDARKSDIFVELLEHSYQQIQLIRESKSLPPMNGILHQEMPSEEMIANGEFFPIHIDGEIVGYIEFERTKAARKLVPDIDPEYRRVMRLISSHLDKIRYETVITEISRIIAENERVIAENERVIEENKRVTAENARITAENISLLQAELHTDMLTGLSNRRGFFAKTEQMLVNHPGTTAFMLAIDIDFFKRVNDTYGHAGGDAVLKKVAKLIKSELDMFTHDHQTRDINFKQEIMSDAGRIGGEEFAIEVHGIDYAEAEIFAEKLRLRIKNELREFRNNRFNMIPTPVTISIGISQFSEAHEDETVSEWQARVLDNADAGLYHAKRNGRDQVVTFERVSPEVLEQRRQAEKGGKKSLAVLPLRYKQRSGLENEVSGGASTDPILGMETPDFGILKFVPKNMGKPTFTSDLIEKRRRQLPKKNPA